MTKIHPHESRGFEYGVKHILLESEGLLVSQLAQTLETSESEIAHLLSFGAVYVQNQRVTENISLPPGTYVRVHTKPRRFRPNDGNWKEKLVYEDDHFAVVRKIAGLPVNASVDNLRENLQAYLEETLQTKLYGTHRLDVPTQGLIVFAKTLEFQSTFNRLLNERLVQKKYRAKVEGLCPVRGLVTHYMEPSPRAPKTVSPSMREKWLKCELIIEQGEAFTEEGHTLLEISLLTGRTHQIRAQLSALGFPICGDRAYGAQEDGGNKIALEAFELSFTNPLNNKAHHFKI